MKHLIYGILLLGYLSPVLAQPAPLPPDPPVRYDTDWLPPAFHQDRRDSILNILPENGVAVFFSAPVRTRQNDVNFEYRQSSDLLYLTGTHEPGSVLILAPDGLEVDGEQVTNLLLVPPRDPQRETWTGRLFGPERAAEVLEIQPVVDYSRFEEMLAPVLADTNRRLFHLPLPTDVDPESPLGEQLALFTTAVPSLEITGDARTRALIQSYIIGSSDADLFDQIQSFLRANPIDLASQPDLRVRDLLSAFQEAESYAEWDTWRRRNLPTMLRPVLDQLRAIKTEEELALMQKAIDITAEAHIEALKAIEPGMYEYEVEALIEYTFKRNGAEYTAFPSIVGSGENTTILHYETNRRQLEVEDLILMDVGAEYRGYAADITRTVPVNGTFSEEQRAIYELVLAAQEAGIAASRAGAGFSAPDEAAEAVIARGLADLGIIDDPADPEMRRRFFMHSTSHYLGLDVHDVGDYGTLQPGNVITVEPGIYISPSPDVDPKWWNIGVRIEDDVLVTEGDPQNLSAAAPRTVEEIEALMAGNQSAR